MAESNSGFVATTEEMERAATHAQSVNDTVQADLRALRSQLDPLRGAWSGMAAVRFAELMTRWDTDAQKLNAALLSISEAIRGSATTYREQDEAQSSSLSSITTALG